MSSSSSPVAIKRACDACHRRKVKCIGDGSRTCRNCLTSNLTCTYNAIPQKKGPKGSRAKVISELRETQRQLQVVTQSQSSESPSAARRSGLLSTPLITLCLDFFFAQLYPTQPVLDRQHMFEMAAQMETDLEAHVAITALCAYMCIQPALSLPDEIFEDLELEPQPSTSVGIVLLQDALRVRKGLDYTEHPTVPSILTSFFFFGSYFCLDRHALAWFHLREATTLALIIGMQEEQYYDMVDAEEGARRRRLYWLLFVTERVSEGDNNTADSQELLRIVADTPNSQAYALQQHRPLTLHATINLPGVGKEPNDNVELLGFVNLVKLFRPFDDTFIGLWNKSSTIASTPEWLARLQQQLSEALPTYLRSTESQAVDLKISQSWLRIMAWQLSMSHGYLSSTAQSAAMGFHFPVEVSRDLVAAANDFTTEAMEIHGTGLIEKLFDIACTLTDVISILPQNLDAWEYNGPREYLHRLTTHISTLRGGSSRYLPLLVAKINDTMPNAPSYSLPPASQASSSRFKSEPFAESTTSSHESTPFGSSTFSPTGEEEPAWGNFEQAMDDT